MACHGLLTAFLLLLWLEKLWFILSSMTSYILWTMVIPSGSDGKESICNEGDMGSIPGLGRDPGGGNGHPLQYSGLENSMNRGAWQAACSPWVCKESELGAQLCIRRQDFPCGSSGKRICLPVHLPQETWVWSLSGERTPGRGNSNPLQYFCLENPMDEEATWATVRGAAKSDRTAHASVRKEMTLVIQSWW